MPTDHGENRRLDRRRATAGVVLALASAVLALAGCASSGAADPKLPQSVPAADTAAAAANAITVSPLPGTSDASPSTQISFLGGAGTTVTNVKVVGSLSGSHSGRLEAYSTGTGESFLPAKAFTQGETVSVSALVNGGSASGQTVHTAFTVAHQAPINQPMLSSVEASAGKRNLPRACSVAESCAAKQINSK